MRKFIKKSFKRKTYKRKIYKRKIYKRKKTLKTKSQRGSGYTFDYSSLADIPAVKVNYVPDTLVCENHLPHSDSVLSNLQSFGKYIGKGGKRLKRSKSKKKNKLL